MAVRVKRVYDSPAPEDGTRVLVDRLWPRGLAKDRAALDVWCKEVAPSTDLRHWYGHEPELFEEFDRRYRAELEEGDRAEALEELREMAGRDVVTLLTAVKALDISHAAVLASVIDG